MVGCLLSPPGAQKQLSGWRQSSTRGLVDKDHRKPLRDHVNQARLSKCWNEPAGAFQAKVYFGRHCILKVKSLVSHEYLSLACLLSLSLSLSHTHTHILRQNRYSLSFLITSDCLFLFFTLSISIFVSLSLCVYLYLLLPCYFPQRIPLNKIKKSYCQMAVTNWSHGPMWPTPFTSYSSWTTETWMDKGFPGKKKWMFLYQDLDA